MLEEKNKNYEIEEYVKNCKKFSSEYDSRLENITLNKKVQQLKKENKRIPKMEEKIKKIQKELTEKEKDLVSMKEREKELVEIINRIPKFMRKNIIGESKYNSLFDMK